MRLALTGPSGSGKTLSALLLAKGIGGSIAVLDTERDSASLYASSITLANGRVIEPPEFDSMSLSAPYTPERYIDAIRAAEAAGYTTMIIDSITHEWSGVGGCLELVDEIARARYRGNSWSAWNDITPRHRALLDAILQSSMHMVVTIRSKTETAQQEGQNGKKNVVKLGMKAEQRDGFEYEMTIVLDLTHDGHFAAATKDRTGTLMGGDPFVIAPDIGKKLLDWLEAGAEPGPTSLTEKQIADFMASFETAETTEELQDVWAKASAAAKAIPDPDAFNSMKATVATRLAAISAKAGKMARSTRPLPQQGEPSEAPEGEPA